MGFLAQVTVRAKLNKYPDAYYLYEAQETKLSGHKLKIDVDFYGINKVEVIQSSNSKVHRSVDATQLQEFENLFSLGIFNRPSNYRDVKSNDLWRSVYDVEEDQAWPHAMLPGRVKTTKLIDVVCCRECGVLIPLSVASVDHQGPQSNGEGKAMCRFFRSVGCTNAAPKGMKSRTLADLYASKIGGVTNSSRGTKEDRYTLNYPGVIYYSLLKHAGMIKEFSQACMHSGFNLRPVCPPCNSSLSNRNGF